MLTDFRADIETQLQSMKELEQRLNIDEIFNKSDTDASEDFIEKVFKLSKLCSKKLILIAHEVVTSSVSILKKQGREPPCSFAVVGLGSVARGEATPYSDLEYIFIVESNEELQYFKDLAMDTYFRLGNCGERDDRV